MSSADEIDTLYELDQKQETEDKPNQKSDQEYNDDYEGMDRQHIPLFEKNQGNKEYKMQNYTEAIKHYSKSIMSLDILVKDKVISTNSKVLELIKQVQMPALNNLAQCYINLNQYEQAINHCNQIITIHEQKPDVIDNSQLQKVYYRKAISQMNTKDYQSSRINFKKALELGNDPIILQKMQILVKLEQKQKEKEKKVNEKFIESLDYVESVPKYQFYQQKTMFQKLIDLLKCNYCLRRKQKTS